MLGSIIVPFVILQSPHELVIPKQVMKGITNISCLHIGSRTGQTDHIWIIFPTVDRFLLPPILITKINFPSPLACWGLIWLLNPKECSNWSKNQRSCFQSWFTKCYPPPFPNALVMKLAFSFHYESVNLIQKCAPSSFSCPNVCKISHFTFGEIITFDS